MACVNISGMPSPFLEREIMKKTWRARIVPYLFLTPTFILLAIFSYYAIGNVVYTSFTDSSFGQKAHLVGLKNYIDAFQDEMFLVSFRNQFILTVATVFVSIFFPVLASELLFFIKHKKVEGIIKTAFVVPMLVPGIVVTLIWKFLYNPNLGFNAILRALHLDKLTHNWLNDPSTALACIIFVGFPFVSGMYFLIMHTGLNMIGAELYEAAIMDGATQWDVVRSIHIPNLKPYIKIVMTLSLISSLSGFGLVAATTGGGPGYTTMIPAMQMYNVAFGDGKFGYASALGVLLFFLIIILTLLTRRMMKEEA